MVDHVKTSYAVDAKVRKKAEDNSNNPRQPRYDLCGNNCRTYAEGLTDYARGAMWRQGN